MKGEHQRIHLDFDLENRKYSGWTEIIFSTGKEKITFNSDGEYHKIICSRIDDEDFQLSKGRRDDEFNLEINKEGTHKLYFEFEGKLNESLVGLYLAKDSHGNQMVTTQFEDIDARKAFPCFDHPGIKFHFKIELCFPEKLSAISNMKKESERIHNGKKTVEFYETPLMSAYLIYIGIGDFEFKSTKMDSKDISLIMMKGSANTESLPLDMAVKFIQYYENYFGIPYALDKMDLILVPEFAAGAMENWGAITFRENALAINKDSGETGKKRVAEVIAHELAHQWFGNLVTMKWWDDLWLNESFATFMAYKAVDHVYPEMKIYGRMMQLDGKGALEDDAMINTAAIETHMKDPEEMSGQSVNIRYGKGAMILRMIENYMGEEKFREGVQHYLRKFSYGNAEGKDLWNSISEKSGIDINGIMEEWISRPGYPVVTAQINEDGIKISQKRFLLSGKKTEEKPWPLPIIYEHSEGVERILFNTDETTLKERGIVKLNRNFSSFHRTIYDSNMLNNIVEKFSTLSFLDQMNIVMDLGAEAISGMISLDDYVTFASKVWKHFDINTALQLVRDMDFMISISKNEEKIKRKFIPLISEMEKEYSSKTKENQDFSILIGQIDLTMAKYDDNFAEMLTKKYSEVEKENPEIREAILTAYGRMTGDSDGMIKKYQSFKSDEDRIRMLRSFGWVTGEESFRNIMKLFEEGKVKKQDITGYFSSLALNVKNRGLALKHFIDIRETVFSVYRSLERVGTLIYGIMPYLWLDSPEKAEEIIKNTDTGRENLSKARTYERIEIFSNFNKRHI
ncbi:M1 family metallopeptidase [Caldiplasma sukawensis]